MEDILLTCQSVTFVDGYPVLRKVFRHLARTPKTYRVWVETARPGPVHFVLEYSSGAKEMYHPVELRGDGSDAYDLALPVGYEGGVSYCYD